MSCHIMLWNFFVQNSRCSCRLSLEGRNDYVFFYIVNIKEVEATLINKILITVTKDTSLPTASYTTCLP